MMSRLFSTHRLTYVGYINQAGVSIKTHLCPSTTRLSKFVLGVDPTKTVHHLPKDQAIRNARLKCIFNNMPEGLNENVFLCSSNFTIDSFLNYSQHATGFSKYLLLKAKAVPSILSLEATSLNMFIHYL